MATVWWALLALRGLLPAASPSRWACWSARSARQGLGRAAGRGRRRVHRDAGAGPDPPAVSANLGDRTAAWLYDRLTEACVEPPGIGHLEDPALAADMTVARDFDLGMTGPPLSLSMDFIAGGLVALLARLGLGGRAVRLRLVGAAGAGRRLAGDALAAAGERRLARPQHRRGAAGAAGRRLRLPAGGRPAGGEGGAAVRAGRLGDRPVRRPPAPPARSCSTRRPGCASGRCSRAC